jgi:hypothetical protein
MRTNLTRLLMCFVLMSMLVFSTSQAQVFFETGKIGVRVSDAGAVRIYAPSTNDNQQLSRVNIIAALSEQAVSDYNDDHDAGNVAAALVIPPTLADTEVVVEFNSEYASLPPKVYYRLHVYSWINESYVIARFTAINQTGQQGTFYLGVVTVPRIAGSYGGETDSYNATHQTAFCYRAVDTCYAGYRLVSAEPFSYHALDWTVYSPDDPSSDMATDSTRYHMTADAGFDGDITAGGDGSILSLNAGAFTLADGDSAVVYYAMAFAKSENDLMTATDAAQAKYNALFTAIDDYAGPEMPSSFSLQQNYPNPFNPTTFIQFTLSKSSDLQLNVYNLNGQYVKTIAAGNYSAGAHLATWDGRDSRGKAVASGIYLYRLTSAGTSFTKKMILVR